MKTFRMIGMALLAVLLSVNLVSCDKDDDGTGGGSGAPTTGSTISGRSGKKLLQVSKSRSKGGASSSLLEFKYDAEGRLVEVVETYRDNGEWRSDKMTYSWELNKITSHYEDYEDEYYTYTLVNGKVAKGTLCYMDNEEYSYNYSYDKDGHIKECYMEYEGGKDNPDIYTWNSGRLFSIEGAWGPEKILYEDGTCKGFCPILYSLIETVEIDEFIFIAHPELLGIETSHLPSEYLSEGDPKTFEYELNSDGYVIGCAVDANLYDSDWYYKFVWE